MFKAGLEGWLNYELIDTEGRTVQSGEQHNLIVDQGLDVVAQVGIWGLQSAACVGTGSTAPATNQTALVAEIARTSAKPVADVLTKLAPGVYENTVTMEFDFPQGNGNLTEWGFSHGSNSSAGICVRELFRDAQGTPIVLTKTDAQKLRLVYRLRVTFGPVQPTAFAFNLAGVGQVTGRMGLVHRAYSIEDGNFLHSTDNDERIIPSIIMGFSKPGLLTRNVGAFTYDTEMQRDDVMGATVAVDPYITGSYRRTYTMTLSTSEGNMPIWGLSFSDHRYKGKTYSRPGGLVFAFDSAVAKDNAHTLSIQGVGVSWGRA